VVASPERAEAFVAWLRAADGKQIRLLRVDGPRPWRTSAEVAMYAELVMLEEADSRPGTGVGEG
jgi:hypothetical protein